VVYDFSLRIPRSNRSSQYNLLVQLFQGLGDPINSGKTIWIGTKNARFFLKNDLTHTVIDIGPVIYDRWMNVSLQVYLSTSSSGRAEIYVDGLRRGSITGEPTQKIEGITTMFVDVIDFGGILGIADFDNVQISTGN
jgi:hypothetical protein